MKKILACLAAAAIVLSLCGFDEAEIATAVSCSSEYRTVLETRTYVLEGEEDAQALKVTLETDRTFWYAQGEEVSDVPMGTYTIDTGMGILTLRAGNEEDPDAVYKFKINEELTELQFIKDESDEFENTGEIKDAALFHIEEKPKAVCIDGRLYVSTGEETDEDSGDPEGEISTSVENYLYPTEDDQSNFGTGCSYRMGEEGTVLVQIPSESDPDPDVWVIFKEQSREEEEQR